MRIGVISDIHGNCVALDAVLADVANHPVDRWVCLGDALQGGPQPREVLDRLLELGCPVVLGNADAFVLDGKSGVDPVTDALSVVRDWTVDALGPHGVEAVRTFVKTYELELDGAGTWLCFHGSPDSYDTVLLPETPSAELREHLGGRDASVMSGGHTHLQWSASLDGWMFFNPGSVGLVYNRHLPPERFSFYPAAEFVILSTEDEDVRIEFCRAPFDVDALDDAARAGGHPDGGKLAARYRPPT